MKHARLPPLLAAAFALGCAHSQPKTAVVPPVSPGFADMMKDLDKALAIPCLGVATHAYESLSGEFTAEDKRRSDFRNYAHAFEDAQEVKEYVECLEKHPGSDDFKQHHPDAVRSLAESETTRDRYAAALPPEKRIVAVKNIFTDVDAKHGRARTEVTQKDGTVTATEVVFEKNPTP